MELSIAPIVESEPAAVSQDGRRARRDRNTDAVIDAVLAIFSEGDGFPTAQQVADRSGVSLRSVFRYFQDIDALVSTAVSTYLARHAHLFAFPLPDADEPLASRIERWAIHRVTVYEQLGPALRAAFARSHRNPKLQQVVESLRMLNVPLIELVFAPELATLNAGQRRLAVAAVHTASLFDTWDNMSTRHELSSDEVKAVLRHMVAAALSMADGGSDA